METLSKLLHELIDHAVPQGNRRGALHVLADELVAELAAPAAKHTKAAKFPGPDPLTIPDGPAAA